MIDLLQPGNLSYQYYVLRYSSLGCTTPWRYRQLIGCGGIVYSIVVVVSIMGINADYCIAG